MEVITEIRTYLKEEYDIEVNDGYETDALNEMFDDEIGE
jgi:uncharacterized protein (DUF2164 family)